MTITHSRHIETVEAQDVATADIMVLECGREITAQVGSFKEIREIERRGKAGQKLKSRFELVQVSLVIDGEEKVFAADEAIRVRRSSAYRTDDPTPTRRSGGAPRGRRSPRPVAPISPKQEAFLNSLLDERPAMREAHGLDRETVANLSKKKASHWIEQALNTPKSAPKVVAQGEAKATNGIEFVNQIMAMVEAANR